MSILYDDVMTNILILNDLFPLVQGEKRFTHTTEWIFNQNGLIAISKIVKGKDSYPPLKKGINKIKREKVGGYISIYEKDLVEFKRSVITSESGFEKIEKTSYMAKGERLRISNSNGIDGYIEDPCVYVNNKLVSTDYFNYSSNTNKYRIEPEGRFNVNETYKFRSDLSLNGQHTGECGRIGNFTFKLIEIHPDYFIINVLSKDPDGVAFPHGLVRARFSIEEISKKNLEII